MYECATTIRPFRFGGVLGRVLAMTTTFAQDFSIAGDRLKQLRLWGRPYLCAGRRSEDAVLRLEERGMDDIRDIERALIAYWKGA